MIFDKICLSGKICSFVFLIFICNHFFFFFFILVPVYRVGIKKLSVPSTQENSRIHATEMTNDWQTRYYSYSDFRFDVVYLIGFFFLNVFLRSSPIENFAGTLFLGRKLRKHVRVPHVLWNNPGPTIDLPIYRNYFLVFFFWFFGHIFSICSKIPYYFNNGNYRTMRIANRLGSYDYLIICRQTTITSTRMVFLIYFLFFFFLSLSSVKFSIFRRRILVAR